ncbi:MAG: PfkB family carbohydrate kinase [Bacteroidetes bacterium]|nr:PfkB family carbohydrate kinase [Bacteroidota bacterium]
MEDFKKLFTTFTTIKAGVIGDIMLDTYMWGKVERISPEAPVPIVSVSKKDHRIGGAGNVALNCRSLGAQVAQFSVTGNDEDGKMLVAMLNEKGIKTNGIISSDSRITTNKTRVISRNQQMMRLDTEITAPLTTMEEDSLLAQLSHYITNEKPAIIIFEDYNKGVLTERVISEAIRMCRANQVLTAVDPKRMHFFTYRGVNIFKPNLKEVKEALNLLLADAELTQLQTIHSELLRLLDHQVSFITLSEKGVFYQDGTDARIISSHIRDIADVSGAGDTVIAVAALVYAATKNTRLMAEMANIAGGLVCEEVGTVAISRDKLLHECEALLQ